MPAVWRLAINSLSGRRGRTALLAVAAALAAALIAAVSCAMLSLGKAMEGRVLMVVGDADLRVKHVGGSTFDAGVLATVRAWPEVESAVPRLKDQVALKRAASGGRKEGQGTVVGYGLDRTMPGQPPEMLEGRWLGTGTEAGDAGSGGEYDLVVDTHAADELGARVGDVLEVVKFGEGMRFRVVGVSRPPPLSEIAPTLDVFCSIDALRQATDSPSRVSEVDLKLKPPATGSDAKRIAAKYRAAGALPKGLLLQETEKVMSGMQNNLKASRVGVVVASVLSCIASAFIIMTGLTTSVTERARELSILRSIGAMRWQLAVSQLLVGLMVGLAGAAMGSPLGVLAAWLLVKLFPDQLPTGFAFNPIGVPLAAASCIVAGVLGAAWPAVQASRTTPLEGLSVRSRSVKTRWLWLCLAVGIAGPLLEVIVVGTFTNGDVVFWGHVAAGVPAMMTGAFVLGVPLTLAVAVALGPALSRLLGLPGGLLTRTVTATPYRHGFTAGAMMLGLAMMVAIWTSGRTVLKDYLDTLRLPDAFIYGLNFRPEVQTRVAALPQVASTCAITRQGVDLSAENALGVKGMVKWRTSFFGFDPKPFFEMTRVDWVEPKGEAAIAAAIERVESGGAVLVAKEFLVARGLGVGSTLKLTHDGVEHSFEVAGAITSPGLEIASKFLEVDSQFVEQAMSAVFGSRRDMVEKFGNDSINFIQINFKPAATDAGGGGSATAMADVRRAVGGGILLAVSATEMKERINEVVGGALLMFSCIAIGAMLIACLGVANLIVAGIQARQFEFGVLRAVGAQRGLLGRLVLGEALVIALAACVLGCGLGLLAAWAETRVSRALIGIVLTVRPSWPAMATGCSIMTTITLGAAMPSVWRLVKRQPRELIAAMKG